MEKNARNYYFIPVILAGFLVVAIVVGVPVRIPIGDSWAYGWSARQLAQFGHLRLSDFGSPALVGQLFLTYPIARVFSADPAVLNCLTYVVSAATACLFYAILCRLGFGPGRSLLGVGTLVLNPIYLAQSVTYDTEIYFLFVVFVGLLFLLMWGREDRLWCLWAGAGAFGYAVLIRQHAIVLALVAAFVTLRHRGLRTSTAIPWLFPIIALIGFEIWLATAHGIPKAHTWQAELLKWRVTHPQAFLLQILGGITEAAHYLGLFLLPLLPIWGGVKLSRVCCRKHVRILGLLLALIVIGMTVFGMCLGSFMPYLENILTMNQIFYPLALAVRAQDLRPVGTIVTAGLALLLILRLATRARSEHSDSPRMVGVFAPRFLGLASFCLLAATLLTGFHFDRYCLVLVPFLIPLLLPVSSWSRSEFFVSLLLVTVMGLFSIYYVDQRIRYFSCRWDAAASVVAEGYEPYKIDGGFAFNGHHCYERLAERFGRDSARPFSPAINPEASVITRPINPTAPEQLASSLFHRSRDVQCGNRPGLMPYVVRIYYLRSPTNPPPN